MGVKAPTSTAPEGTDMKNPKRLASACALALALAVAACSQPEEGTSTQDAQAPPTTESSQEGGGAGN